MARNVKTVNLSLPPTVVSDLDLISNSLDISRSAFVSALLLNILPQVIPLVSKIDFKAPDAHSRRYRGEFIDELTELVGDLCIRTKGTTDDSSTE